jgi:hypothetical protein
MFKSTISCKINLNIHKKIYLSLIYHSYPFSPALTSIYPISTKGECNSYCANILFVFLLTTDKLVRRFQIAWIGTSPPLSSQTLISWCAFTSGSTIFLFRNSDPFMSSTNSRMLSPICCQFEIAYKFWFFALSS